MSLLRRDFPCNGGFALVFDQPVSLLSDARDAVGLLTALTIDRLRRDRLVTRKVVVWLEASHGHPDQAQLSSFGTDLPVHSADFRLLSVFTRGGVDELYRPGTCYRQAGVYCEDLAVDDGALVERLSASGERALRPYGVAGRSKQRSEWETVEKIR